MARRTAASRSIRRRRWPASARKNGVPVWLTVYTDEGHLLPTTRANNDFLFYTWIRFVQEYLLN